MNTIKIGNKSYKYESFWRDSYNKKTLDSDNKQLPWPIEQKKQIFQSINSFLEKLKAVEEYLDKENKFINHDDPKKCLICDKKRISTKIYSINNIRWEDGLKHYIEDHNIKPSDEFIDFIFRYTNAQKGIKKITRIHGIKVSKSGKKYLKLERNQILIMDALMRHGGFKIYKDDKNKNVYRYSEHAGLLDFNNEGLEKIIISGNTTRVDVHDDDIFLPKNMIDAFDYEYIFHTHPPTPKPGGRVELGILYEFPSISDLFHFMDHYNKGQTQGSIIIAPEGMYIIRKKDQDDKLIKINEDKMYNETNNIMWKCQREAIDNYGTKFSSYDFFSKIAQDSTFISKINKVLNKYMLHIDYYPRIRDDKNRWIIDSIYLPVYVIESTL